jgi:uncharacterized protein (TIGR03067 family)
MTYLTTAIVSLALAATAAVQETKQPKAVAALQGTWVITSLNGQTPPDGSPQLSLTFTGEKYHQTLGTDVNERGSIKVDATKKPMTIDLIISEGQDAGKTQLGIFEVTGDTLRAHLDTPGMQQRPADFTAKEGFLLFVAKKKKA